MKKIATLALATAACFATTKSFAEDEPSAGLLGKSYLGVNYSYVDVNGGDLDDFGHGDKFGIDWNMKMSKRLDLKLGWEQDRYVNDPLDVELTRNSFFADLTYIFMHERNLKPYVTGSLILQDKQIDGSGFDGDDSEFNIGYGVAGGLEWSIGKRFFTNAGLNYRSVDNFDDLYMNLDLGLRVLKKVHAVLGFDYDLEDDTQTTMISAVIEL